MSLYFLFFVSACFASLLASSFLPFAQDGFTAKLVKFNLQGPALARASSRALGGALSSALEMP